jgi:hypothetical protein
LTLAAAAPTSVLPPAPQLACRLPPLADIERLACRDIDPSFVREVAPPQGVGPLWGIARGDASAPLAAKPIPQRFDCPRLIAASAGR